ncbi:MAG: SRPBCC domain-containing protein [Phycisphaerales bacterium]|nr:SRPBCC domain-containing protein [Planctomycetota bacterium]MCH8508958.1 SRPBCC domain-containing protein [Phycisphaerales bacterium]
MRKAIRSLTMLAVPAALIAGCASQRQADTPPVPPQNPRTDFATARSFEAPPELVWEAWTSGETLQRWWGPRGFTCPVADMDVRVGGTSLVAMQAPPEFGGTVYYNTWTYSTIVHPHRLDFVVRFSDEHGAPLHPSELGLPPGIPAEVPHVLIFEPTDDGGTRLTIIEYGYESQDAINLSRQGLEQCLDKLAETLAP